MVTIRTCEVGRYIKCKRIWSGELDAFFAAQTGGVREPFNHKARCLVSTVRMGDAKMT